MIDLSNFNPKQQFEEGFDPSEEQSKAVVARDEKGVGCILWWTGEHLRCEIDAGFYDLSDLGLDDAPHGISIWEGIYVYYSGSWENELEGGGSDPKGTFRSPTDDEWGAIKAGRSPWGE